MDRVPQLIGPEEAARILGLHRRTVYEWAHGGRLPCVRIGRRTVRFDRQELIDWIDARRQREVEPAE